MFTSTGTYTGAVIGDPLSLPLVSQLRNDNNSQFASYTGSQTLSCWILSYTGVTSGLVGHTATGDTATVSASGYTTEGNIVAINQMISSTGVYSGYSLTSTSTGTIDNFESYSYSSGISYPFDSSKLISIHNQFWYNVFDSGMNALYPAGWGGEHSLASGFAVVTGTATGSTTITYLGQTINDVNELISGEIQDNRKYCATGDPSYFTTGEIVNLYETGYFYGYC